MKKSHQSNKDRKMETFEVNHVESLLIQASQQPQPQVLSAYSLTYCLQINYCLSKRKQHEIYLYSW